MDAFSFGQLSYFIAKMVYYGFTVFAPILLLLRFIRNKSIRLESVNLLSSVNLIFSFGLLFQLLVFSIELYLSYREGSQHEYFVFGLGSSTPAFIVIGSLLLIILLFLFVRFRKSWILTLLALVLLNMDLIISVLMKLFRDYRPSAWSTYYPDFWIDFFIKVLLFGLLSVLVYFMLAKTKKLPYPSIWVR